MTEITPKELAVYENIVESFIDNVVSQSGLSQTQAQDKFADTLSFSDKARIIVSKLRYDFAKNASPEKKARRLVAYCESTLKPLTAAFGEAALADALPEDARTQRIADLTETLGGTGIAKLIRKTL